MSAGLAVPPLHDAHGPLLWRRVWPTWNGPCLVAEAVGGDGRVVAAVLHPAGAGWRAQQLANDPQLPGLAPWLGRHDAELVAHRAHRRAVVRFHGTCVGWVKVARPRATARALQRITEIAAALRGRADRPRLPVVRHADPVDGVLVLEPVSGQGLADLLLHPACREAPGRAGRAVAAAITVLAGADGPGLPQHTLLDEADTLYRWVGAAVGAGAVRGAAARALRRQAETVTRAVLDLPTRAPVTSHRDLHEGQVLLQLGELLPVGLLDLDTAASADAVLDTANLLAHLDLLALRHPGGADACEEFENTLVGGLAAAGHPAAAEPVRLALLRRASQLRLAAVHAFRPDAELVVPALLGTPAFRKLA